jgi:hypothetical protein
VHLCLDQVAMLSASMGEDVQITPAIDYLYSCVVHARTVSPPQRGGARYWDWTPECHGEQPAPDRLARDT